MKCNEVELGDFLFVCQFRLVLRPFDILWLSRLCVEPLVWKTENGLKFPLKISSSVADIPETWVFGWKKRMEKHTKKQWLWKIPPSISILQSWIWWCSKSSVSPFFFSFGFVLGSPKRSSCRDQIIEVKKPYPVHIKGPGVVPHRSGPGWSVAAMCRVQRGSF